MSRWGNSKELTRTSYDLVRANPGMNRWVVRAVIRAAVVGGVGLLVGFGLVVAGAEASGSGPLGVVLIVLGALVVPLSVLAGLTAGNMQLAGLVAGTDDVLHGRALDEQAARDAARSRLGALAGWSAISMAVGTLVSVISGDGDSGFITSIVRGLLAGMVAAVWAVVTALVMPVLVLEKLGAVASVKRSAGLIRSTWGEQVFGSVRIGARFFLTFTLPGILLVAGGIVLAVGVGGAAVAGGVVLALVGVVLVLVGAMKAATCRNVFGVALYRWATGEGALGPFTDADLRGAVAVRGAPVPVA